MGIAENAPSSGYADGHACPLSSAPSPHYVDPYSLPSSAIELALHSTDEDLEIRSGDDESLLPCAPNESSSRFIHKKYRIE